ncbi:MAG: acyltransferase family protein [Deltaproteobacteria bacterium]|nr:acyltransferase family protein [Deltaproteobacteria bacterium]MBI3387881.1 acyltransferase family protein [Deltaproteobacteria bacterium]
MNVADTARPDPFGFDPTTAERWLGYVRAVLWPYFRPQVMGTEHLPRGRALIVGCHSGVVPYDAACTLVAIHEATGRFSRAIGDNLFGRIGVVENFLRRQGALVGHPDVVAGLLRAGHMVLVFPGGAKDMERPYLTQRYQVLPHRGFAPGRGGYIKLALRTRTPIVPLAVVGAEEAHVMLGSVPGLGPVLGMPFFPLLLFPVPLPVRLYIRFGKPITLPGTPADAHDQTRVDQLNEMVRRRIQRLIADTVTRRRGLIFSEYRNGRAHPQ